MRCLMMSPDTWLAIIASSILIVAYVTYNWDIIRKKVHPNTVSWALWSFISALSFTSYKVMTGDWIMSALPVVTSLLCILTFFLTLHLGRFSKLAKMDIIVLALGIITSIVWLISRSATYANLILQGCYILAYIPTYRSVWKNPANEKFLPWFLWSSACIVNLFVVFSRWEGNWPALVYPVNGVVLCTFISILALRKNKPSKN